MRQTGTGTVSAAPAWDTVVAADIPGSALTKTDDTNVTLTLGGSPTTALLNAASLTLGWTGQLGETRGGTNQSTYTQGDILYSSASNTLSKLAKNTSATRYLSNTGTSNNPAWAQIDLTNGVTGILPNGNTTAVSANTASTIVLRDGSGNFSAGTITAALTGNASTATTLATPRTIGNVSFNGSANIVPETILVTDEISDTTCFPLFVNSGGTLAQQPKTTPSLSFNASTNNLTTTTFTGALAGNSTSSSSVGTTATTSNQDYYLGFYPLSSSGNQSTFLTSTFFYNPSTFQLTLQGTFQTALNIVGTGSSQASLVIQRGDATSYAQSLYNSGATLLWATGLRASDSKYHIFDPVNGVDALNITPGATPSIAIPSFGTSGIVHNSSAGALMSSLIVDADVSASAAIVDTKLATISTALKVSNSATTAASANTASAIVARDGSGNFSAGTITASLSGNASTVTTNANLTGPVTSSGNATSVTNNAITNAMIRQSVALSVIANSTNSTANVADLSAASDFQVLRRSGTALAFGSINLASSNAVTGVLVNANTTGTDANTASSLVLRDASGNFSAGTVTLGGLVLGSSTVTATTSAPGFLCRGKVSFDGTAAANLAGTYGRTLTDVTVTATAHGLIVNNVVYIDFTSGGALDGTYTVTSVPDANTFHVTTVATGTIALGNTLNLLRRSIRAGTTGCISNISYLNLAGAVGSYYVNFNQILPDISYGIAITGNGDGGSDFARIYQATVPTTTGFQVQNMRPGTGSLDTSDVMVAIFY